MAILTPSRTLSLLFSSAVLTGWSAETNLALIVPPAAQLRQQIRREMRVTRPDYVVFTPQLDADNVADTGNEHFLVFDGPDGSLMAIWTQSTHEGERDHHIVFSKSQDEGKTWSKPSVVAGPARGGMGRMASWAFPLVSKSGRIYVIYDQQTDRFESFFPSAGDMTGIYSDDNGRSWSAPEVIAMPRTSRDNPDHSFPANWICWQKPLRLGRYETYLAGFTRWTSKAVKKNPGKTWVSQDSVVEFMRFENVDANPAVGELKVGWLALDANALQAPLPGHPDISVCQEPSIVKLPDKRLFCVMRTMTGSPYWSVSVDGGEGWSKPKRLLEKDAGQPLKHPLSPCPIYDVNGNTAASGNYVLFIHNNDGHYEGYGPEDTSYNRRPIYLITGHFHVGAEQPVWFDKPRLFMDHTGTALGPPGKRGRLDLAMYSSLTVRNGSAVLWYPDRKFFLLGKIISAADF
jgi:hypothetical protein